MNLWDMLFAKRHRPGRGRDLPSGILFVLDNELKGLAQVGFAEQCVLPKASHVHLRPRENEAYPFC